MKIYRFHNGDACPCCGQTIQGKTDAELEEFSLLVFAAGMWLHLADWIIRPEADAIEKSPEEMMQWTAGDGDEG